MTPRGGGGGGGTQTLVFRSLKKSCFMCVFPYQGKLNRIIRYFTGLPLFPVVLNCILQYPTLVAPVPSVTKLYTSVSYFSCPRTQYN